jgi:hypothetical protein
MNSSRQAGLELRSDKRSFSHKFVTTDQQHRELLRTVPVRIGLYGEELVDLADLCKGVEPGSWISKADLLAELR